MNPEITKNRPHADRGLEIAHSKIMSPFSSAKPIFENGKAPLGAGYRQRGRPLTPRASAVNSIFDCRKLNAKSLLSALLLITLPLTTLVGCQKGGLQDVQTSPQVGQPAQTPNNPSASKVPAPANAQPTEGTTSGAGGGYVSDNSRALLDRAKTEVASELENSSAIITEGTLPAGWTVQKMAQVIRDIRLAAGKEMQRDGQDLMFNYGTDDKGPYIEALRPFFNVYGSTPIQLMHGEALWSAVSDIKIKLIHEVAHHLGLNEEGAKSYSLRLWSEIMNDYVFCTNLAPQIGIGFMGNATQSIIARRTTRLLEYIGTTEFDQKFYQLGAQLPKWRAGFPIDHRYAEDPMSATKDGGYLGESPFMGYVATPSDWKSSNNVAFSIHFCPQISMNGQDITCDFPEGENVVNVKINWDPNSGVVANITSDYPEFTETILPHSSGFTSHTYRSTGKRVTSQAGTCRSTAQTVKL